MQQILMNLWDACAPGGVGAPQAPARGDLAVHPGAVLPIRSTVPALRSHGFIIPIAAGNGYLDLEPEPGDLVTILFDGFWSQNGQERLWLYVQDSMGHRGWIHRGMVLQPPSNSDATQPVNQVTFERISNSGTVTYQFIDSCVSPR